MALNWWFGGHTTMSPQHVAEHGGGGWGSEPEAWSWKPFGRHFISMIALKTKSPICNFTPKARNLCDVCWPRMKGKIRYPPPLPPALFWCLYSRLFSSQKLPSWCFATSCWGSKKTNGQVRTTTRVSSSMPRLLAAPCNHLETFTGSNGGEEEGGGEGVPGLQQINITLQPMERPSSLATS